MSTSGDGTPSTSTSPTNDHGPTINAVQSLMIVLSSVAIALRFVARRMSNSKLWWDDWCLLLAWVFCLGCNITILDATKLGLGRHLWQVADEGHDALRNFFVLELLFTPALAFNKLGVLLMYHRLFGIERSFQIWGRVLFGIVIAWSIGTEIANLLQCQPVEKFWEYQAPGHCVNLIVLSAGTAIPNVIIDIVILLLPQPYIRNLSMSWTQRFALAAIFFLGAFTAVTSLGRLVAVAAYDGGYDFTYYSFTALIWYSLEPAVGIISACLPCYGPLLRKLTGSPNPSRNHSAELASQTDVSRGTGGGLSSRGSRHRSSEDTESVIHLTQMEISKSSRQPSVRESLDEAWPGSYQLNTLPSRKATHSSTRKHS